MDERTKKKLNRWKDFYNPHGSLRRMIIASGAADASDTAAFDYRMYWPEYKDRHIEWILASYADAMRRAQWLDDDSIPHLSLLSGTEIFAECFGCGVHRPEDNMPFALPLVNSTQEADGLKLPSLWDSPLRLQFEMADAVRRQEPDAIMRLPDIQSPLDIAALIWEKSSFYCDLVEAPEAVHSLLEKIYALLTAFLDQWFERYGYPHIAHYPEYPIFQGITISEDEIGALSPSLFDEFAAPYLSRLSQRYGGIGIHCCANSRHQWEGFAAIDGLYMINLCQPGRVLEAAAEQFAHVAQWPIGESVQALVTDNPRFASLRMVETLYVQGMERSEIIESLASWRALHIHG